MIQGRRPSEGRTPFVPIPMTRAHAEAATRLLGRAFVATPTLRTVLAARDEADRLRVVTAIYGAFVRTCLRSGRALVALDGSEVVGVVLLYSPGRWPLSRIDWLRNGLGGWSLRLSEMRRLLGVETFTRAHHPREPHDYLYVIGVDPAAQGRGVGSDLMRTLTADADERGVPIHLETDDPENVRFYRRFGFELTAEEDIPTIEGVRVSCMWRSARSRRAG